MTRCLFLPTAEIETETARGLASQISAHLGMPVTLAIDDFDVHGLVDGGWARWPYRVVRRLDEKTQAPVYTDYAVVRGNDGTATQLVLRYAIAAGRTIHWFDAHTL